MARSDRLPAYVPGKAAAPGGLKLSSNELPFDPVPSVLAAVQAASADLNRYPDHGARALRERIAGAHGLDPSWVAVGCGSVGLLQQLCLMYAEPGAEVVYGWRSFEAYPVFTALAGATPVEVPLDARTQAIDLDAVAAALTERTTLVLLADPNNPSGTTFTAEALERFISHVPPTVLVVLDRAYHEFVSAADAADPADVLARHENVCVLRTFSKAHGLASLRVGYLLGRPEVVQAVDRALIPFAVNGLAQAAALACFETPALTELASRTAAVRAERARLARELRLQGIPVADPQGNFVWVPGLAVEPDGVTTRAFPDGTRITVGSAADCDRALDAIAALELPRSDAPKRAQAWLDRLDVVEQELVRLAGAGPAASRTEPDPGGDERWEQGQVWAHLAEIGPYWLEQLGLVLDGAAGFGRTKKDPHRNAAIEQGRTVALDRHLAAVQRSIAAHRRRLCGLTDADWSATSEHPTLGRMDVDAFLQHFVVGHLEEHAAQLRSLR